MRKACITLLFVHIAYSFLHAQEYEFYSTFTSAERIGKEHVENNAHGETLCIVYLGRMEIGKERWYVLTQFSKIETANSIRGKSLIIFLNEALSIKRLYEVDLPEELPTHIIDNKLIVREEPVENLLNELPDVLCLPRGGCYD